MLEIIEIKLVGQGLGLKSMKSFIYFELGLSPLREPLQNFKEGDCNPLMHILES